MNKRTLASRPQKGAFQSSFGGSTLVLDNLAAHLLEPKSDVGGYLLRPRRTQKLLHPHRVSSLAQHFATSTKISEVLGTQLLPDPRPELTLWPGFSRRRHLPTLASTCL